MNFDVNELSFNEQGLIPAIIQDYYTNQVLMLGYMNKESLMKTLETETTWFYSRSRQKLWNKGETSGHVQHVKHMKYDCDRDTLLVQVEQVGAACHTGNRSCFYRDLYTDDSEEGYNPDIVPDLYEFLQYRKDNPEEGSYTSYLFREGLDKILKKVGEETSEVIIGAKNHDRDELIYELSDLIYHSLVLMVEQGVKPVDLKKELSKRHAKKKESK
ncbi:MAG: bifunctional phosphoribosyl-AMP cyclohydrolase/phosphoribosyl-ATP diphosphatase HisIE [Bacillaceae bacterium]|nr:bifunctional phosphoribosyl-AMP cyclohydrolase/phosphoribosyl-ATP diphosphatase HisIE [Bacillaceae bacterium]